MMILKRAILPLLLLFFFLFENMFATFVPTELFWKNSIAVPHFFMIILCFITVYYGPLQGVYYGLLFGFLFDIVYTELVGVYIFAYPILAYLVYSTMRILQLNLFIVSFIVLAGIVALEYYVYGFLSLLGRIHVPANIFFTDRLLATVLLNGIFLLIVCFPLRRYLVRLSKAMEEREKRIF
ncbi:MULTISPECIES: rod shape-determining protein MreD [Bacillus cereus group]|uniref:Rod shape-determining protein MreD n=1 Tax=Bacillus cytotoxicus TaxID=580165 RepID=A0AAX2CKY7_9BACI|nr:MULTISPECIES: rod shape-determining protein MreD [Bacillus cereus group]MDH2888134.1 rod shape-determining protein MreD [Bacillus cytotoxicus]QTR70438.1 rod shape-determining protein MreD [Bacillus cytotoxicus]QTR79281.1 rod shape-determining protein MreD [Bacillus cytotoxicus]QTR84683.1 rod shape-determining protein MreD [Bacillus cytotoxicus]QTR88486.1 rod shape-determining protein MreD [Bacillus cytotoxicus]